MSTTFEAQHGFGVGSIIEYRTFGGGLRRVEVINVDDDIKNGRPGFDAQYADAPDEWNVWGYCDQVVRVVSKGSAC